MPAPQPVLFLDDATPGRERYCRLSGASRIVAAYQPEELPAAFAALARLRAEGRYVGGYFSYELGYLLEPTLAQRLPATRDLPLLWFAAFERLEDGPKEAQAGRAYVGPLRHEWDQAAYRNRFDAIRRYIAAGDIYQANLSFRAQFTFLGDPQGLYRELRARSGAAYCAYIDDGARQILSLSPELFFEVSPGGEIITRPMKGTIARGSDAAADAMARTQLAASAKDRAENLMIVDLLRNDLGRVAEIGSVKAEKLFDVETYPTLHAMVSTVKAQLRPGASAEEIICALFPCGSVTGAPKIRAMEILSELEDSKRGAYCGAIGYFAPDGSARFNVAIRTITIQSGQGSLGIGGGVVQDSSAESEYAECLLKARYFEDARKAIGLIETLRYEPDTGFVRVARHLGRMENSAKLFSLPFNHEAALAALKKAVQGAQGVQRVRLVLEEGGIFTATSASLPPGVDIWRYVVSCQRMNSADQLLRHKTTWRQFYDDEHASCGAEEVLFLNECSELTEGSRTNIFIRRKGRLLTPALSCGVLGGVLRQELLEGGHCEEAVLTQADLEHEVYLGNSLRGLIRAESGARRECAE